MRRKERSFKVLLPWKRRLGWADADPRGLQKVSTITPVLFVNHHAVCASPVPPSGGSPQGRAERSPALKSARLRRPSAAIYSVFSLAASSWRMK